MGKVMCFGTFDLFHPGHESFLKQAKAKGDYLIVVVARDTNVLKAKDRLPEQNEKLRLENIQKTHIADKVLLGGLKDKYQVIRGLAPDIICLGYDQTADTKKLADEFKIEIIRLRPYRQDKYKSSKFAKRITQNA